MCCSINSQAMFYTTWSDHSFIFRYQKMIFWHVIFFWNGIQNKSWSNMKIGFKSITGLLPPSLTLCEILCNWICFIPNKVHIIKLCFNKFGYKKLPGLKNFFYSFVQPTFVRPTFVRPTFVRPTFVRPTFVQQSDHDVCPTLRHTDICLT